MKKGLLFIGLFISVSAMAQMTTAGTAFQMSSGCDCYELTSSTNDAGAIWSPASIDLSADFDMTFDIYLGAAAGGADGMVFVLQQTGFGVGTVGNKLAWDGIVPSVGWEVDTWNSGISAPGDIAADHLGMADNGQNNHNLVAAIALPEMEDGFYHTMQITWDASLTAMAITIDGSLTGGYAGDLVTTHFGGSPNVFFGFTGSTGGAWNIERVCMTRQADFTPDLLTVCKGTTVTFTDASTSSLNNITNWDWDFGDGSGTSTLQNPTYVYTTDGTMTVSLTITDASGCTDTYTVDVEVLPDLDIDSTVTHVACFGDSTGIVNAVPVTGTGPYNYSWDDPGSSTTSAVTGLPIGTYTCDVTDALGCQGSVTVTVIENSEITISGVTTMDDGTTNGTIDITVGGGAPGVGGYTFSWSPGGATTEDLTGLASGSYTVTVTDSLGCTDTMTFFVGSSVGIIDLETGANIYPNPTNGYFKVETNGAFVITITDIRGRMILEENGADIAEYDLSDFEAGVYMVQIKKDNAELSHRLILK
jgi:PKD repeat protein